MRMPGKGGESQLTKAKVDALSASVNKQLKVNALESDLAKQTEHSLSFRLHLAVNDTDGNGVIDCTGVAARKQQWLRQNKRIKMPKMP